MFGLVVTRIDRAFFRDGVALTALVCLVSMAGLEWASYRGLFSPVVPVAGVAVAGLFLRGCHLWPWVFVGSLVARHLARPELSLALVVPITLTHTAAYLAAAAYLRYRGLNRALSTLTDVKKLIVAACIVGAISALAPFFQFASPLDTTPSLSEVLGDVAGNIFGRFTGTLIVAAPILTFFPAPSVTSPSPVRIWKNGACLIGTLLLTLLVFSPLNVGKPVTWLLFPPLIVTALTGGSSLVAKALFIVGSGALWGTTNNFGPFANEAHDFIVLQEFLSVIGITGLVLAAVATERRDRQAIQQRGEDLQFLSNTAVELLSSSELLASVHKMVPGLAARCNVDIVTYHATSLDSGGPLKLIVYYGFKTDPLASSELVELELTIQKTVEEKFPLVAERVAHGHAFKSETHSLSASLCQPIVDRGEILGTLSIASYSRPTIDTGEARLLETVAYYIATAAKRLRQKEQLRESEARFRELANAVPDIVWVLKADGSPDFYNERWYEFIGELDSSKPNVPLLDLCEPSEREVVARRWKASLHSGERLEIEHQLKHHSGVYRWVLTRAVPIRAPNGDILRWFGTSTDLHEKKVLEAERASLLQSERVARTEAEQANRVKDEFLAVLSHELRNPLNAIVGWAHLLSREKVDTMKAARIIEHNARLQAQLIDDLLDMSRIVSGKLTLKREVVRLSDVVSGTVDSMQLVAREKGVVMETSIEPNVELSRADISRITQIVSNLLTNAIKFTPQGGRVTTTLATRNREATLTVTDTGEGITPEFLPNIFERFRQADPSTTRRHGGLGIGLAIAKYMTSLHGGSISASSAGKGRGATFTVVLPLKYRSDSVSTGADQSHPPDRGVSQRTLNGSKIVVVEDDPSTLEFLSQFLSDKGSSVVACNSGAMALDAVSSQRPDIIISDIGMPEMDGYQLVRYLRGLTDSGEHLPIIALTAFARAEDEAKALQSGFDAHLAKPIDPERLERVMVDVLRRHSQRAA